LIAEDAFLPSLPSFPFPSDRTPLIFGDVSTGDRGDGFQ
jgi:hypothetical protein